MKLCRKTRFLSLIIAFFGLYLLFATVNFIRLMNFEDGEDNFHNCEAAYWERSVLLDSKSDFVIKWKLDGEENIGIMMSARTVGWLSVGFSRDGKMAGSDIVMGWIANNKIYLQDRKAIDNSYPILDQIQNYYLVDGKENETHTVICFWRKLNTCDEEDFRIKNGTVRVIWAYNDEDPADGSINSPRFHGENKGSKSLYFLDANNPTPVNENVEIYNVTMNNLALPNVENTMYACTFFKIPDVKSRYHFIGYEPLFQENHKWLIHHMLLHSCHGENVASVVSQVNPHGESCHGQHFQDLIKKVNCYDLLIAWTDGSVGEFYPQEVGYMVDSLGLNDFYFKLEVHYHNELLQQNIIDNSGVRIYLTKELRPNDAGMFVMSMPSSPGIIIPPNQQAFTGRAICFPECTKFIPPTGIKFFAIFLHAHLTGRAISLRLLRNGKEIDLYTDDYWDPSHENDTLILDCTYNTEDRTTLTFGGHTKYHEMCRAFIQYYPKIPYFLACQSEITVQDIDPIVDFQPQSTNMTEVYTSRLQYVYNLNWNENQIAALQNVYYKGYQITECIGVEQKLAMLPNFLPYEEANICGE